MDTAVLRVSGCSSVQQHKPSSLSHYLETQYQVGEDCRQLSWVLVYIYVPIAMMFHFVIGFLVKY